MRVFVVLSMVLAAAFAAPNNYYAEEKPEKTEIRIEAPVRSSYESPSYSSYESPVVKQKTYEAPVIRTTYTPPPVVKSTYEVPAVKYEAPVVKGPSFIPAPIRTVFEAPKYETPKAYVAPSYAAPSYAPKIEVAPKAYAAPSYAPKIEVAPKAYAAPSYGGYGETLATKEVVRPHIPIVSFSHQDDNRGTYRLEHKTGHGITHVEHGTPKDLSSKEGPVNIKAGSYSYTGPDGKQYAVNWTADEHGFRASGDHLPTPPPIPADIQKSLAVPRIREFQPEFEHEHRDHERVMTPLHHTPLKFDHTTSFAQPSLPVRSSVY